MVDTALREMSPRFDAMYGEDGRKSIAPERLLRALLAQLLYSVRSERMLVEELEYNLLFRWFVGLAANEAVWHAMVFTKSRDRLLEGAVAEEFFSPIVEQARVKKVLSDEHFTVDGTLIEASAGQKSFQSRKSDDDSRKPPPNDPGTIRRSTGTSRSAGTTLISRSPIPWRDCLRRHAERRPSLLPWATYSRRTATTPESVPYQLRPANLHRSVEHFALPKAANNRFSAPC